VPAYNPIRNQSHGGSIDFRNGRRLFITTQTTEKSIDDRRNFSTRSTDRAANLRYCKPTASVSSMIFDIRQDE